LVAKFFFTNQYGRALGAIEDFIFATTNSIEQVIHFLDEHDDVLEFIAQNPETPVVHPATGDQSWIFCDGRYRVFFCYVAKGESIDIFLTDIIDNRQANLHVYSKNSIPTYSEE